MKLRYSLVFAFVALFSTGCASRYFMQKDAYSGVKKVALVQYAINPHMLLGTANADESKSGTVDKAWEIFGKEMANQYQVMPLAEMTAHAGYTGAGGKAAWEGFYTSKGVQYFSADEDNLRGAMLTPDAAKKLCEALGVDGVAAIYESWGVENYALGFKGRSRNAYVINLFDKNGARVYGDWVWGTSEDGFATPAGIISTDVATYVLNNHQAFTAALKTANEHIAGK